MQPGLRRAGASPLALVRFLQVLEAAAFGAGGGPTELCLAYFGSDADASALSRVLEGSAKAAEAAKVSAGARSATAVPS